MSDDARTALALGDCLDMTAAAPLCASLLARRGQAVTLDASQVRRIGGQCLQVLLSARSTWLADGQAFQIIDPSPEFAEGVSLLGCPDLASPGPAPLSLIEE